MIRFRAATYNVHKCRGLDWQVRPERILRVVDQLEPNVIALQEVFAEQAEYFARETGMAQVFGPVRMLTGRQYGNAVLSRFPMLEWENHDVTVKGREPRRILRVDIQLSHGVTCSLFNVHLGTSFFERRLQAVQLLSPEIIGRPASASRRIVAGDFNEWTHGTATRLLSEALVSADRRHLGRSRTYPAIAPFMHLDHIYYDPAFQLRRLHLHQTRAAFLASDHLPLVADFEI